MLWNAALFCFSSCLFRTFRISYLSAPQIPHVHHVEQCSTASPQPHYYSCPSNLCLHFYQDSKVDHSFEFLLLPSSQPSCLTDSSFTTLFLSCFFLPMVPNTTDVLLLDYGPSPLLSLTTFSNLLGFQVLGVPCWKPLWCRPSPTWTSPPGLQALL